MFGTGLPSENLIEEILKEISEEALLDYYLGIRDIPCLTNCPYRRDNHPSLGIYYSTGGHIESKDFATGENVGGTFQLLARTWNTTIRVVLLKIWSDLKEGRLSKFDKPVRDVEKIKKERTSKMQKASHIEVTVREWQKHDQEYWESYGVPLSWLDFADVYPVSYIHYSNFLGIKRIVPAEKYAYVYVERKEGKITKKIYQPFSKKYKWSGDINKSVISLWTKVPDKGDRICICSSLKDALCLWANTGIPAIALQGEAYPISDTALNNLRARYQHIFVCFDNDIWGKEDAIKFSAKTGITNIVLPEFDPYGKGKDISDLYKFLGDKQLFVNIITQLFNI